MDVIDNLVKAENAQTIISSQPNFVNQESSPQEIQVSINSNPNRDSWNAPIYSDSAPLVEHHDSSKELGKQPRVMECTNCGTVTKTIVTVEDNRCMGLCCGFLITCLAWLVLGLCLAAVGCPDCAPTDCIHCDMTSGRHNCSHCGVILGTI